MGKASIKIGRRLNEIRIERCMTLIELQNITGITYTNLIRIEKGRCSPSVDTLDKICKALHCSIRIENDLISFKYENR